jgi:uncharacterized protein YceK
MKKIIITTIGLLLFLAGCSTTNTKESSTKESVSTTESSVMETSVSTESTAASTTSTSRSSEAQTSQQSTSVAVTSQTTTQSTPATQPVKTTLWSTTKSAELASFMSSWGQEMGQQYQSYDNQSQVDYYGLQVPKSILDGEWTMVIDQTPVSVEWTDNGEGEADFQLVAVYSDINDVASTAGHLYFFGFQQEQPKVFITQQNQGNPNNYLYFKETENSELKNGFSKIANR